MTQLICCKYNGKSVISYRVRLVRPDEKANPAPCRTPQIRGPLSQGDGMVEIKLTQGLTAVIDKEDADIAAQYKWYASKAKNNWYALSSLRDEGGGQHNFSLHRLLTGAKSGEIVDHINGNGLDNRRCNLRKCSTVENGRNRVKLASHNTSGVTGVHFNKRIKRWTVSVAVNGRRKHIGCYADKEEAITARRFAELSYYGVFAPQEVGQR